VLESQLGVPRQEELPQAGREGGGDSAAVLLDNSGEREKIMLGRTRSVVSRGF
jgi:hypothetical protein